jgi:tetratricopeptide (TPR) repeat protein
MLYLIVPPIIIVITLVLLLWYLAKKANDPLVSERVEEMEARHQNARLRTLKEWRLRVLEKFAQRSKTSFLRMHNVFNAWLQSIRASRKQVQAEKELHEEYQREDEQDMEQEAAVETEEVHREVEGAILHHPAPAPKREEGFGVPLMRRRKRHEEGDDVVTPAPAKIVPARVETERPMVSEKMALPESANMKRKGGVPEEDLIARIATNPKDFEAYEALGDFYMENGNIKDAKECYRQVLKLSPVQRMVKIKIRRLEKLLSQKG